MIQISHIFAIIKRHLLLMRRDIYRVIDITYWPFLNIFLWGTATSWASSNAQSQAPFIILSSLILWQIVQRAYIDIALSLKEELFTRNTINLFSSPVRICEWMLAVMIIGFMKSWFTFLFGIFAIKLLFGMSVWSHGPIILAWAGILLICGWTLGLFISTCLILWGYKIESLIWAIGWLIGSLSGVFYPIKAMPLHMQTLAYCLPTTYVFESVRAHIAGQSSYYFIAMGIFLAIIYYIACAFLFKYMFERAKCNGLAALER